MLNGVFTSLAKLAEKFDYDGPEFRGYGVKIEEDGDCGPGDEVCVRKKSGEEKTVKLGALLHEDPWKVVFAIDGDDSPPAGARQGTVRKTFLDEDD